MRATRKRFTVSRTRIDPARARAIATREGVSRYKHSTIGRSLRLEAIQLGWQRQGGVCAICEKEISLSDSRLRDDRFTMGQINPVVCSTCRRQYRKQTQSVAGGAVAR